MPSDSDIRAPIALLNGEGEAIWFLNTLTIIKASGAATGGRFSLVEQLAPRGAGSPLHRHTREDEWFYVLEGELTFWVDGRTIVAPAGAFMFGPRNEPHTFLVTSETARYLVATEPSGFDEFVRAVGRPAAARTLPPASSPPPDPAQLGAIAARFGIEILGPPGIPD